MLGAYRRVLTRPGAAAFSATGLVARLPISMMTLGIVLLVSTTTGSCALAGQVSAAYVVGNTAFAVGHGRLGADVVVLGRSSSLMVLALLEGWSVLRPHLLAVVADGAPPGSTRRRGSSRRGSEPGSAAFRPLSHFRPRRG